MIVSEPMHPCAVVAMAYRYPTSRSLQELSAAVDGSLTGAVRQRLSRFIDAISELELGRWEELHTNTLDLSPLFVPYVGHVTWGESYRRGEFMVDLKQEMDRLDVDLGGELPDHIEPILRYLAATTEPLADLAGVISDSVKDMASMLDKADSANPYRHVLAATRSVVDGVTAATPVTIGGPR